MANKDKVETPKVSTQSITVTKPVKANVKKETEPTYTISEFASAPETVEASADIVVAALSLDGKENYTVTEAKEIVKKFKEKEVK